MTEALRWQKSSFSGGGEGDTCVELAATPTALHLRESDTPTTHLTTTPTPSPTSWQAYAPGPSPHPRPDDLMDLRLPVLPSP